MKNRFLNRFLQVCLDVADWVDASPDPIDNDLCRDIGLGYRVFDRYIRHGVSEVVQLRDALQEARCKADLCKTGEEDLRDRCEYIFGDRDLDSFTEEELGAIKNFVEQWEAEHFETERTAAVD